MKNHQLAFISFIIGLSSAVKLDFGFIPGTLFLGEVCFFVAAIFNFSKFLAWVREASPVAKRLLLLIGLWFFSALIVNPFHDLEASDYFRALALPVFLLTNFIGLWILAKQNFANIIVFICGKAISEIILIQVSPNEFQTLYPWKFGYAIPVAYLTFVFVYVLRKHKVLVVSITLTISAINAYLGYRSLALVLALSFSFILGYTSKKELRVSKVFTILKLMFVSFGGYLLVITALNLASESILNRTQLQSTGALGILIGGRPEIAFSTQQIKQSPLFGIGSYNSLSSDVYTNALSNLKSLNYQIDYETLVNRSQVIHSYLFENWIYLGFLASIIWLYAFYAISKFLFKANGNQPGTNMVIYFFLINLLWAILFSPFGLNARFDAAIAFTLLVLHDKLGHSDTESSNRREQ